MTTITGYKLFDMDLLDEEYLGPPPRFLVEDRPEDLAGETISTSEADETATTKAIEKFRSLLGLS